MSEQNFDTERFDSETGGAEPTVGAADADADEARTTGDRATAGGTSDSPAGVLGTDVTGDDTHRDAEDGMPVGSSDREADMEASGADSGEE